MQHNIMHDIYHGLHEYSCDPDFKRLGIND